MERSPDSATEIPTEPVPRVGVSIGRPEAAPGVGVGAHSDGHASDVFATGAGFAAPRRFRRRQLLVVAALVVVVAVVVAILNPFSSPPTSSTSASYSTYTVKRQTISSQTQVSATLGYSGTYTVAVPSGTSSENLTQAQQAVDADEAKVQSDESGVPPSPQSTLAADEQKLADDQASLAAAEQQATIQSGAFSQLPTVGQVVDQGQTLYTVVTTPVVLLYGSTPATRNLFQGESGADVAELNTDLRTLGYSSAPTGDEFTAGTTTAVNAFEAHIGVPQSGNLALGQVVFLPGPARVTAVNATLGGTGQPGSTVLTATSTTRQVTVALDATLQADVKVGDAVTVTLPDQSTTPGVVSSVGTVASTPSNSGNGNSGNGNNGNGDSTPTIEVDVRLTDPAAAGNLDQAPVNVSITNNTAQNALVVPVNALLALASGGYALEIVPARGPHYLVPVSTGLFDDAEGLVQVTGSQVHEGMRVVVPSS